MGKLAALGCLQVLSTVLDSIIYLPLVSFKCPHEQASNTLAFELQASDEAEDDEDMGALAAFGCLQALSTVLDSVSRLPHLFPQLEDILFPVMQAMCTEDGQDVFEEILEMISYFTYFSPEVAS